MPTIHLDIETDGRWHASIPSIPGAMAYGATREEAIRRAKEIAEATEKMKKEEK